MIMESEMISPQGYIQQHKGKTLEGLIKERNKLLDEIREYEETHILNKKTPEFTAIIIYPSPSTVYFWHNRYLNELTDLIIERKKESKAKASIDRIIEKNTIDITSGVLGVEEITRGDNKAKINREEILEKLRKNQKTGENIHENIINNLKIIEDEINKYEPIKNDEALLGIRQKFVSEEFDRYIAGQEKMYVENKYYQTYYDIEQFIEGAEYPADRYQNPEFKYSKYMSSKEVKILMSMINRLKSECQKELGQQSNSLDK